MRLAATSPSLFSMLEGFASHATTPRASLPLDAAYVTLMMPFLAFL